MSSHKIFISYQGGAGGDLITASLNGLQIALNARGVVPEKNFSLKSFEPFDNLSNLIDVAKSMPYEYLSTHEFNLLHTLNSKVINLVVTDPTVRQKIILRQMCLQNLKIYVDYDSDWFRTIKTYCKKHKYLTAAKYWFERAVCLWNSDMDSRLLIQKNHIQNVLIDTLFAEDFPSNFNRQIMTPNKDCLVINHSVWLGKNHSKKWQIDTTLESMCLKLKKMNWDQESGVIICKNVRIKQNKP